LNLFRDYPKTDDDFWGFATPLVNREAFGYLLLTRQTTDSIKSASFAIKIETDDSDFNADVDASASR
jgi:hypothetical protein